MQLLLQAALPVCEINTRINKLTPHKHVTLLVQFVHMMNGNNLLINEKSFSVFYIFKCKKESIVI
jgi:hypothetical protein